MSVNVLGDQVGIGRHVGTCDEAWWGDDGVGQAEPVLPSHLLQGDGQRRPGEWNAG